MNKLENISRNQVVATTLLESIAVEEVSTISSESVASSKKKPQLTKEMNALSLSTSEMKSSQSQRMGEVIVNLLRAAKNQPTVNPSPAVKKQAFDMVGYMLTMMNAMIETMSNQAKTGQESTEMSAAMITLSKQQLDQANADLQKLMQEEYDESHRSFWDKLWSAVKSIVDVVELNPITVLTTFIKDKAEGKDVTMGSEYQTAFSKFCTDNAESGGVFSYLIASMMIVLSPFCGGTSLALMGIFMVGMQASGAQSALDDLIKNEGGPLVAQIFEQIAIALAEAIVIGGIGGAIDSAVASASKEAAADTAATMVQFFKNGLQKLFSCCRSGAEDEGIELDDFSNGAVGNLSSSITADSASESSFTTFIQDLIKKGFGETRVQILKSIIGKALMQSAPSSLWSNMTKAVVELVKPNIDPNDEQEICAISGAILGIFAAISGGLIDATQGSGALAEKLFGKLGEDNFQKLKMTLTVMTTIFALEQSAYLVQQGLKQFDLGDTLYDLNVSQGVQEVLSDMLDRIQMISANNNSAMNSQQQADNNASANYDEAFVQPWSVFA